MFGSLVATQNGLMCGRKMGIFWFVFDASPCTFESGNEFAGKLLCVGEKWMAGNVKRRPSQMVNDITTTFMFVVIIVAKF